ncbi:hypothetical protein D3C73_1111240 [compost metagenome]
MPIRMPSSVPIKRTGRSAAPTPTRAWLTSPLRPNSTIQPNARTMLLVNSGTTSKITQKRRHACQRTTRTRYQASGYPRITQTMVVKNARRKVVRITSQWYWSASTRRYCWVVNDRPGSLLVTLASATTASGARKNAAKNNTGAVSSRPGESQARRFMAVHRSGAGVRARTSG